MPVQVNGHFEARWPPDMTPGTELNVPMSFNIVLQLEPSTRYSWVLEIEGQTEASWQVTFATRQAQGATGSPIPAPRSRAAEQGIGLVRVGAGTQVDRRPAGTRPRARDDRGDKLLA